MRLKTHMNKFAALIIGFMILFTFCSCENNNVSTSGEDVTGETETENYSRSITITCAGDCTLGTDVAFGGITLPVEAENQGNDYSYFLRNVQPYFATDDLTIVNFEGTLTDRGSREEKTFAFRGKPEYTKILTEGSVEAVTLANNHSRDYGEVSLEDTRRYLDEAGVIWFENLNTRVVDVNGVKLGLVGLYALNGSAEGNLPKAMEQVKAEGAEVIMVQIHWGIEGENYPSDDQISLAHASIDAGADLVIGHHPHVLQGIEKYKGRIIAYSLGNFCFGGNQNPRDKDSMILRQTFTIDKSGNVDCSDYAVIPVSISSVTGRNNYQPTPSEGSEKERISEKIQKFSDRLGDINVRFEGEEIIQDASSGNANLSDKEENSMLL